MRVVGRYYDDGVFDGQDHQNFYRANIDLIKSLNLDLKGARIVDIGAGYGFLGNALCEIYPGSHVTCTDFKEESVNIIKERYPHIQSVVANAEEDMAWMDKFTAVFCYSMLYHLENPVRALRNMGEICKSLMVVETCVLDSQHPAAYLTEEEVTYIGNGVSTTVNCVSPRYLTTVLNAIGFHVYRPLSKPDYFEYNFEWRNDMSTGVRPEHAPGGVGHKKRIVAVASREELNNNKLVYMDRRGKLFGWE